MFKKKKKSLSLNDPVISGRETIIIWQYLLKHGSGIEKFFDGINIPRKELFNKREWIDIHTSIKILKNYRSCLPDYDMTKAFDVAYEQFGSYAYGIFSAVLRLTSIRYIIKAIPYLVSVTSKIDLFRFLKFNHHSAIIEYTIYPGFEAFIDSSHIYTWLGVFTAIPTLHGMPPAKVEAVASFVDVFKKFRKDFAQFNHRIEEKNGIIYLDGEKAGKWITIKNDVNLDPVIHKYLLNEKCILWEKDVIETKKSGNKVTIAKKGDLYNCSKTLFRMEWKNKDFLSRSDWFFSFSNRYVPTFLKSRKALFRQTDILYELSRILKQRVKEKTDEIYKAQAKIIELEKRSIEHRITGGFAHEMRNALAGAQLEIKAATHYRNSKKNATRVIKDSTAVLARNISQMLQDPDLPKEKIISDSIRELSVINETADYLSDTISGVSTDIERGLSITTQIHEYSKLHEIKAGDTPVDIVQMLNGYKYKYEKDFKDHGISYSVTGMDSLFFKADEVHVNSIFSNLILNARDALVDNEADKSEIRISVEKAKGKNCIKVKDNGPGMDKETLREIFEPFFSTKPSTGMGLGLGIAKRTIALYGGQIKVESKKGSGTLFKIILPG